MRLYTFGSTRKTDGHLTSHGYRRDTARAQSEIVGPPRGHRTGSLRFPLKVVETLRFPYDRRTVLMTRKFEESQNMKSYDAHMNRKQLRRSPLSPTMSKFLGKIADRKIVQLSGQMLPSRHDPLWTPYDRCTIFVLKLSYKNREVSARSSRGLPTAPV